MMPPPGIGGAPAAGGAMPDFSGLSLRRALAIAHRRNLNLEVKGSGYVIAQQPPPDAAVTSSMVRLVLAPELAQALMGPGLETTGVGSAARTRRSNR